jgi:hypothetical protein
LAERFNIFDEITQSYSGKFFAYAEPSLSLELHRGNGHRVRFNSDLNFPQILERIEGVLLPKPIRKRRQDHNASDNTKLLLS